MVEAEPDQRLPLNYDRMGLWRRDAHGVERRGERVGLVEVKSSSLSLPPYRPRSGHLRDHAALRGWTMVGAYVDPARSGRTLDGRPGFAEMIAAAERGAFQVLLVEDVDRISRDAAGLHGVIEALRTLGVVVCTPDDEGDG